MVRDNVEFILIALEFGAPFLQRFNNCQEFFIVNLIIAFLCQMLGGKESDWV